DPRCVDYIRANKDKYPLEALKAALLKAGAPPADVEEAARQALGASAPVPEIPLTAPPMKRRSPATFAEIFPSQSPAAAPAQKPAPAQPAPARPAPPQGLIARARSVVLDPWGFFRSMPRTGGWKEPLVFLIVMSLLNSALRLVLGVVFSLVSLGKFAAAAGLIAGLTGAVAALIAVPIGAVISAGIAHLIWTLLGSKQPFETSFRCVAFMAALLPVQAVVQALPVVGLWLAIPVSLYGIYLFLPASTEAHEVERKKATAAVLVLGGIVFLAQVVATFALWKLRRMAPQESAIRSIMEASQAAARSGAQVRLPPTPTSAADIEKQVMSQLAQFQAQAAAGQTPDPAQAMQAMNAALGAMGANSNLKAVAAQGLQDLLPAQAAGLPRSGANSGKQQLGAMEMASAEGTYRGPDGGTVAIQLIDAGSYSSLLSMAWGAAGSMPGSSAVTYKSCPGMEQYDPKTRSGSFQIIAAKRFAVRVSGQNVDQKVLSAAMDSVDLDALGRLAP
ncbi:MAG: YIP1 family protein, partial [Elusimicrobia bacterium]|nr:YIP1 family protein [Elusimicrobiota bacterium]